LTVLSISFEDKPCRWPPIRQGHLHRLPSLMYPRDARAAVKLTHDRHPPIQPYDAERLVGYSEVGTTSISNSVCELCARFRRVL